MALASFLEQSFSTIPVGAGLNGVAVYALSIRAPGMASLPVPGGFIIFPLSPQQIHKEPTQLTTIYDLQGPASNYGVNRQADLWGQAPPTYVIRGTTGWKRKSTDGFINSGKSAIVAIQKLMSLYAQLNQQLLAQQATDFYTMEFYDYWMNDFWQVEPFGAQPIDQSADKPIISYYTLHLACIKAVAAPIPPLLVDAVVSALSAGAEIAVSTLTSTMATTTSRYL